MEPEVRGQCVDRNNRIRTEDMKFQLFTVLVAVVHLQEVFQLAVTITAYTAHRKCFFQKTSIIYCTIIEGQTKSTEQSQSCHFKILSSLPLFILIFKQ